MRSMVQARKGLREVECDHDVEGGLCDPTSGITPDVGLLLDDEDDDDDGLPKLQTKIIITNYHHVQCLTFNIEELTKPCKCTHPKVPPPVDDGGVVGTGDFVGDDEEDVGGESEDDGVVGVEGVTVVGGDDEVEEEA